MAFFCSAISRLFIIPLFFLLSRAGAACLAIYLFINFLFFRFVFVSVLFFFFVSLFICLLRSALPVSAAQRIKLNGVFRVLKFRLFTWIFVFSLPTKCNFLRRII